MLKNKIIIFGILTFASAKHLISDFDAFEINDIQRLLNSHVKKHKLHHSPILEDLINLEKFLVKRNKPNPDKFNDRSDLTNKEDRKVNKILCALTGTYGCGRDYLYELETDNNAKRNRKEKAIDDNATEDQKKYETEAKNDIQTLLNELEKQWLVDAHKELRCRGDRCGERDDQDEDHNNDRNEGLRCRGNRCGRHRAGDDSSDDARRDDDDRRDDDRIDDDNSRNKELRCRGNRCGRYRATDDSSDDDSSDYDRGDDDRIDDDNSGNGGLRCRGNRCGRYRADDDSSDDDSSDYDRRDDDDTIDDDNSKNKGLRCRGNHCGSYRADDDRGDDDDRRADDEGKDDNNSRNEGLRCKGNRCGRHKGDNDRQYDMDEERDGLRCRGHRCGRDRAYDDDRSDDDSRDDGNSRNEGLRCRGNRCGRSGIRTDAEIDNDFRLILNNHGKRYKLNNELDAIVLDADRVQEVLQLLESPSKFKQATESKDNDRMRRDKRINKKTINLSVNKFKPKTNSHDLYAALLAGNKIDDNEEDRKTPSNKWDEIKALKQKPLKKQGLRLRTRLLPLTTYQKKKLSHSSRLRKENKKTPIPFVIEVNGIGQVNP